MSIENAILELAAAIRYAADKTAGGTAMTTMADLTTQNERAAEAELEKAVTKVETDAKAEKPTTAKAAIQQALDDAKKAKEANDDLPGDGAVVELDYEKDVKPLLVKVGKDKQQLVELLAKFNAKNGAGIAKADYPAVVAAANAVIGG